MCALLQDNKDEKLRRQAIKFISNLSWNPKFVQLLINHGVVDLLIVSLNGEDRDQRVYAVIAISNLSGSPNFHSMIKNM